MVPFAWSGIALGALVWLWRRRAKRRREREKEQNRRAKPPPHDDTTGAESFIVPNAQNVELYVRVWSVPVVQGVVLAIHSFAWSSSCFMEISREMKQRRFCLVSYDLQGHGRSGSTEKTKGDLRRFKHLVHDAEKVMHFVKGRFPEAPLFVLGEGFGGTLALHMGLRNDRNVNGLIVCSPFVFPNLDECPPSQIAPVLYAVAKLLPDLRISTPETEKAMEHGDNDQSMALTPTLRFFIQGHRGLIKLGKRVHHLKCPFVTLHGANDDRASSQNSRELYARARTSQDKTLMIYDNMHSCLFGELPEDRSHVITDILAWLDARTHVIANTPFVRRPPTASFSSTVNAAPVPTSQKRSWLSLMTRKGFSMWA